MERAAPTFAFPWKLKVRTYSPGRVSLCRMTNKPWLLAPPSSTSWAALIRERVPWNQGKSERLTSASASLSSPGRKHRRILGSAQTFALSQPRAPQGRGDGAASCTPVLPPYLCRRWGRIPASAGSSPAGRGPAAPPGSPCPGRGARTRWWQQRCEHQAGHICLVACARLEGNVGVFNKCGHLPGAGASTRT